MKEKVYHLLLITAFLCASVINASAQSFDLRPQTTQSKKADESVQTLLDRNDVSGMRSYLKKNKQAANSNSRIIKSSNGSRESVPLFYDAVERALSSDGNGSAEMCQAIVDAGCDLHPVFDGYTPIYLVMNYIATHEKSQCGTALKVLQAFGSRSDWDANQRYRSNLPPMNYLIRKNYEYLHNRFSKDYIADEVLKILIEHGASATSYTDEGQTLMTFALETDNRYLQSYFADKGVNLTHSDDSGRDDLYRMIDSGNLALLKQLVQNGGVKVTVGTVKNEYNSLRGHKDMFDYVASLCAQNAQIYDDLKLFRERFEEKKSLVDTKYQELCRQETNAASNYDAINLVMARYPDLSSITASKRLSIYRSDAAEMEAAYKEALAKANSSNFYVYAEKSVARFIERYSEKTPYDPDNKVPIAKETADFYTLCDALTDDFHSYVGKRGVYMDSFFGIPFPSYSDSPVWDGYAEGQDKALLEKGSAILEKGSKYGFANSYQKARTLMETRKRALADWRRNQERKLATAKADYERRQRQIAAEMAQEEAAQKEWNNKMESDDAGKYILEMVEDWGDWSGGRFFDSDDDFEDSREINFSNGKSVTIYWEHRAAKGINHYGFMQNGLFKGMLWYTNVKDAVIGAYMDDYENKSWYNGRE